MAPPIIYHESDFVAVDLIVSSGPQGPEKGGNEEMSKEFIKPLTPELRSNINKALDRQRAELKTCESNAFVSVQLVGLQAW